MISALLIALLSPADWQTDPGWDAGPAEWALYDAVRPIYGVDRHYEATIFTNTQRMDESTRTKAEDASAEDALVFKHNVSEIIETENYAYRFLTTSFARVGSLAPYALVASTQEDCGATFHRITAGLDDVTTSQFSYFPGGGAHQASYDTPDDLAFHDLLTLTLRSYPFDERPDLALDLVPDQTHTKTTTMTPSPATVRYVERETIEVPYGEVDTHHLRVTHAEDGGATTSDYWFAADEDMRHVMVKYAGPYGVEYELKDLAWWAYWDRDAEKAR